MKFAFCLPTVFIIGKYTGAFWGGGILYGVIFSKWKIFHEKRVLEGGLLSFFYTRTLQEFLFEIILFVLLSFCQLYFTCGDVPGHCLPEFFCG